jgi:hypothetical protein
MPPRWNTWATIHAVQWDWEKEPKERQVRLVAAVPQAGDPVRVRMSGAEIEGIITDASTPVLRVKVKATVLKVNAVKTKRSQSA